MEYKLTFKQYNEGLKQNKLLGLKCLDCGTITAPPKIACHKCTSNNLEITELKGKGTIKTFTTVNVASEGRENEVPYTIVMVELEEGPWIMGNLDIQPDKATMEIVGKKVNMGHKVFPGDKYSAGDGARPFFSLET